MSKYIIEKGSTVQAINDTCPDALIYQTFTVDYKFNDDSIINVNFTDNTITILLNKRPWSKIIVHIRCVKQLIDTLTDTFIKHHNKAQQINKLVKQWIRTHQPNQSKSAAASPVRPWTMDKI